MGVGVTGVLTLLRYYYSGWVLITGVLKSLLLIYCVLQEAFFPFIVGVGGED